MERPIKGIAITFEQRQEKYIDYLEKELKEQRALETARMIIRKEP